MRQKRYLILKRYNRHRKGDVVEVHKNEAIKMMARGAAVEYIEPVEKKEPIKKAPAKKKPATKKNTK